jgi:tetratricopeptide (TPR) repeat protein
LKALLAAATSAVAAAACTPPALLPDLKQAEDHVHAGEWDAALAAYDDAIESCKAVKDETRGRETCAQAHLGRAELLDRMGRHEDAAAAYEATPAAIDDDPVASCNATYRAGKIRLDLGQLVPAYQLLWRAITDYPDAPAADNALRVLLLDGRRRAPAELYEQLQLLADRLTNTEIGDNLLYSMADLAKTELGDAAAALAIYDRMVEAYPTGALFDDALWHGAALARAAGDARGAVARYRKLLATREVAWLNGSYNSEWFDNSWLQIGITLRDDLRDFERALNAFRQIPKDYPASILLDDAMFEQAVTYERMGSRDRACRALSKLHEKWPDSKYELERGPNMRERLRCKL